MLGKIIQLDMVKILKYVQALQKADGLSKETISALKLRLVEVLPDNALSSMDEFLLWFGQILMIQSLPPVPDLTVLFKYLRWAQKAKKVYRNFLRVAFSKGDQPLPRWVHIIFKLGRYGIAAKALVQTAIEYPALFNPISVASVSLTAPRKTRFTMQDDEVPLTRVLRRLGEIKPEEVIPRLASIWNTDDAEAHFRESCSVDLIAHAELQLINFYDHNPQLRPRLRFIGLSKKSCYLCHVFLTAHPEGFYVSSCHQKIYSNWIPPPAVNHKVYQQYKIIIGDMSKKMEGIAKSDLLNRLGQRRWPIPADSTAGVSLSGLTGSRSLEATDFGDPDYIAVDFEDATETGHSSSPSHAISTDSPSPPNAVSRTPQSPDSQRLSINEIDLYRAEHQTKQSPQVSVSSMVFHFTCLDDTRQNIVTMNSILDPDTELPTWSTLLQILKQDESFGPVFRDSDVMIVNDRIHVRTERQFIACCQYLMNSGVLNSDVKICDSSSTARSLSEPNERRAEVY